MTPEALRRWQARIAETKAEMARGVVKKALPLEEMQAAKPKPPAPELAPLVDVPRSETVGVKQMKARAKVFAKAGDTPPGLTPEELAARPKTRGECCEGPRPCPYVSCRHHNYLDVGKSGSLKFNFPNVEPDELPDSCSLDVADKGGLTLEQTGVVMNVTRERVRQMEGLALRKAATRIEPGEGVWRVQCKERDAETGRQCGLLVPHPLPHRHGKWTFMSVLQPGEEPRATQPDAWRHVGDQMGGL